MMAKEEYSCEYYMEDDTQFYMGGEYLTANGWREVENWDYVTDDILTLTFTQEIYKYIQDIDYMCDEEELINRIVSKHKHIGIFEVDAILKKELKEVINTRFAKLSTLRRSKLYEGVITGYLYKQMRRELITK